MITSDDLPSDITLDGQGPFETPMCNDVELALGDVLARLELITIEGQTVYVPISHPMLAKLHQITGAALKVLGPGKRDTVQ